MAEAANQYATVTPIPAVPALDALTYRIPESMRASVLPGARVIVPLGRRRVTGIVTAVGDRAPQDVTLRDVGAVLDREPILNDAVLRLLAWMADYYGASLAEVASLAVGRRLTAASTRRVRLLDAGAGAGPSNDAERRVLAALDAGGGALDLDRLPRALSALASATNEIADDERSIARPAALPLDGNGSHRHGKRESAPRRGPSLRRTLASLVARGVIAIEDHLSAPATRERTETWVEIVRDPDEALEESLFARSRKRRDLFAHVAAQPGRRIAMRELASVFPAPASQVAALVEAGLLRKLEREVYRNVALASETTSHDRLSDDQSRALAAISESLGTFATILLQGVTASGKTEVYLRAIARVLERDEDALVLVPEISLTHQIVARLVGRFGDIVAVLHSELSAGERWDQWRRIRRREARIVVGARSAVLAPIDRLGIVVVDEEHDAAYKQEDGVRYHGRDVAIVRAQQAGCPVVLGSATPSLESWRAAREGRYRRIVLPARVTGGGLPRMEVVDLRGRDIEATGGISEYLATCMRRNFEDGGQTLLFLNRRGYAASMQCYACGMIVECDNCSVGMTLHRAEKKLRCHHCDAHRSPPPRCPSCSADTLVAQGIGTQRLETTVRTVLPNARIERLDRDTAAKRGHTRDTLETWRAGEIDVLIGTQMISKGHDAGGVTLVGVVQADMSLGVPDFRASERTFQLLSQVAGRAGRGNRDGQVVIQTYRPDHPAIASAVRHDFETFAAHELVEREELAYPPISRLALLRVEGPALSAVEHAAELVTRSLVKLAQRTAGLLVRGPAPAPIEKRQGRHRMQVQLRAVDGRLVRHGAVECRRLLGPKLKQLGVRLLVDIDPVDMA